MKRGGEKNMLWMSNVSRSMVRAGVRASVLAVLGIGAAFLGGCNDELKTQNATLTTENGQLKEEVTSLTQNVQSKDAQIQQLLGQIQNAPQPQPYLAPTGAGPRERTGGASRGTTLTVAGDVLFAPGSATIKTDGRRELDRIASTIRSKYSGNRIRVEGHTDSDPIRKSKFRDNEHLSAERALAVERYLATKGVSASRIEAVGKGASNPKGSKSSSRRVEIVILGG